MPSSEDEQLVEAGPLLLAAALKGCTAAGPLAVVDMAGPDLALGLLAASTVWAQLILRCAHLREVRGTHIVLWSVGGIWQNPGSECCPVAQDKFTYRHAVACSVHCRQGFALLQHESPLERLAAESGHTDSILCTFMPDLYTWKPCASSEPCTVPFPKKTALGMICRSWLSRRMRYQSSFAILAAQQNVKIFPGC